MCILSFFNVTRLTSRHQHKRTTHFPPTCSAERRNTRSSPCLGQADTGVRHILKYMFRNDERCGCLVSVKWFGVSFKGAIGKPFVVDHSYVIQNSLTYPYVKKIQHIQFKNARFVSVSATKKRRMRRVTTFPQFSGAMNFLNEGTKRSSEKRHQRSRPIAVGGANCGSVEVWRSFGANKYRHVANKSWIICDNCKPRSVKKRTRECVIDFAANLCWVVLSVINYTTNKSETTICKLNICPVQTDVWLK